MPARAAEAMRSIKRCPCVTYASPDTCASCLFGVCPGCNAPLRLNCQRHSPIALVRGDLSVVVSAFPTVGREDVCGDYIAAPLLVGVPVIRP